MAFPLRPSRAKGKHRGGHARTHSRDPVSCTSFFEASEGIQDPTGHEIAAENPLQYFYRVQDKKKEQDRNTKESAIEKQREIPFIVTGDPYPWSVKETDAPGLRFARLRNVVY